MRHLSIEPGRGWAFFFDFDGTLVDIAPTPDAVRVPPALIENLGTLAQRSAGAVAVLTGRPIADIDRLLPDHVLDVAGVHGGELRFGRERIHSLRPAKAVANAIVRARHRFGDVGGIIVEDKRLSLAVHWRLVPERESEVVDFMADTLEIMGPDFRLQLGKAVAEILPASARKEQAMMTLLSSPSYQGRLPVIFGDDQADEPAFRIANDLGGIAVKVGPGRSSARHSLACPEVLRAILQEWASSQPAGKAMQ